MTIRNEEQKQFESSLGDQVSNLEAEAKMVLPGIQTLFGFQLMVGFNSTFKEYITLTEQYLHLGSILLVAVSGILVVAPAAYHRQANHQISKHFIAVSSRFLTWALAPLAIGTCLDIYLVSKIMTESSTVAWCVAIFLFGLYFGIWFIYPRISGRKILKLPLYKLPENK